MLAIVAACARLWRPWFQAATKCLIQNIIAMRLHVTLSGAVDGREVSVSSGFADLDEATCQLLTRRSRYDPARDAVDASGAVTDGFVDRSVTYAIPQ